jgi:hypothetical protein
MNGAKESTQRSQFVRFLSSWILRVVVTAVILGFIIYKFSFGQILANMWHADRLLLAGAIFVFVASGVLGACQWRTILRFHGVTRFRGEPSRDISWDSSSISSCRVSSVGDAVRIYKTATVSGKTTQAFSSTLADRVLWAFLSWYCSVSGLFSCCRKAP